MFLKKLGFTGLAVLPLLLAAEPPTTGPATRPTIHKAADKDHVHLAIMLDMFANNIELIKAGVAKYEKESGAKIRVTNTGFNTGDSSIRAGIQSVEIEGLLEHGLDGLAVMAEDPDYQAEDLADVAEKINLICLEEPCPEAKPILTIDFDNVAAGTLAGKHLIELMPDGGKIAVVCTGLKSRIENDRLKGLSDSLKNHKITIDARVEDQCEGNAATQYEKILEMMTNHPDVKVIVGIWSFEGEAITAAVGKPVDQKSVRVVVVDECHHNVASVQSGEIESVIVPESAEMGYQTAKWLHDLSVDGDKVKLPDDRSVHLGWKEIDKSTVDAYCKELEEQRKSVK